MTSTAAPLYPSHGNRPGFELRNILLAHDNGARDATFEVTLPASIEALQIAACVIAGRDYMMWVSTRTWIRNASRAKVRAMIDLAINVAEDQESDRIEPTRAIRMYRAARGGK